MSWSNPFWSWMRRKLDLRNPAGWAPNSTYTGRPVTHDSALSVPAWFAGLRLLSQSTGSTSIGLYRKIKERGKDSREVAGDHQLYSVIHDAPNSVQIAPDFWEGITANMLVYGNGFAEKLENRRGVMGLQLLQAAPNNTSTLYCVPGRRTDGELEYKVHDRGKVTTLPPEKVFHVRGFGFGGDLGLPLLTYARQTLATAAAAEEVTGRNFQDGLRAKGFFVMPDGTTLDETQRTQVQRALVEPFQGIDGKSLGVLEGGMTFLQTNINAHDAELNFLRRLSVEEVCRFLGIPPIMLGHAGEGQTMWGSGVEALLVQFYTTGLRPILIRIEKSIWQQLIPLADRDTLYAEFNIESFLRGDSAARAAFYSVMTQNGIMDRNECRAKENMNARPGGDELTVQAGMVPLRMLAELARSKGQATPPAEEDNPDAAERRQRGNLRVVQ
jgi:HK97 family phage portal protein